jgi:hypothetical protein
MDASATAAFHAAHLDGLASLAGQGYALLPPRSLEALCGVHGSDLDALRSSWNDLPRDTYLRDGGKYRYRRHSCYTYEPSAKVLHAVPHRAHWQPVDYNALHGGMERWFEPITATVATHPAWSALLTGVAAAINRVQSASRWFIEAHQFRIDTAAGIGRPTPEGAHRDGVDFVAVVLVDRHHVRGGETRVFQADGIAGVRFTMIEPWTMLLLDDERVIHETTPIQADGAGGVRDTLVITYRKNGFQAP